MSGVLDDIKSLFGYDKSFYDILNIKKEATKNEVRKAYYKLSLKVHPDRVPDSELEQATRKFQALGKIYEILSDDERRAIYDEDGTVDDECFAGCEDRDWYAYWRLLFAQIHESDIVNFETNYKGSDEELNDLKSAYVTSRGDMDKIIDSILCATVDDEPRFRQILDGLIADGSVKAYAAFTNEKKSKSEARKRKADAESKEAEQAKKKLSKTDESCSLSALILHNQQSRGRQMDAFFDNLATKYGGHSNASGKKQTATKSAKKTASKSSAKSKAKK